MEETDRLGQKEIDKRGDEIRRGGGAIRRV
jgi:hypothetical protein